MRICAWIEYNPDINFRSVFLSKFSNLVKKKIRPERANFFFWTYFRLSLWQIHQLRMR